MDGLLLPQQLYLLRELEDGRELPDAGRPAGVRRDLEPMQLLFIAEYQKDFNGTQAAIRAGYSADSAQQIASRLLKDVDIRSEMLRQLRERLHEQQLSVSGVLQRIRQLIYGDARKLFHPNGALKDVAEWPDDVAARIVGVQVKELWQRDGKRMVQYGEVKTVRLVDPVEPLKMLARYLKMLLDDAPADGPLVGGELSDKSEADLRSEAQALRDQAQRRLMPPSAMASHAAAVPVSQ